MPLARAHWGKGIATEVANNITYYGMKELKLHRIQGIVRVENLSSITVLKKNGYKKRESLDDILLEKFHDVVVVATVDNLMFPNLRSN